MNKVCRNGDLPRSNSLSRSPSSRFSPPVSHPGSPAGWTMRASARRKAKFVCSNPRSSFTTRELHCPSGAQGLDAPVGRHSGEKTGNWREGGYNEQLNKNSRGNQYLCRYPGSSGEFGACSPGADAALGRAASNCRNVAVDGGKTCHPVVGLCAIEPGRLKI